MNLRHPLALLLVLIGCTGCANNVEPAKQTEADEPRELEPAEMVRLEPHEVQPLVQSGQALLVCAYDSDEKFAANRLEGAIPLSAFEKRLPTISMDQPIVFYCS